MIQGVINETNSKFARVENVRTFRMLPKELDHEDGELTATQKLKRESMEEKFRRFNCQHVLGEEVNDADLG